MELTQLKKIVQALEVRFPQHNGPFEYGTRLAEETGELIEMFYAAKNGISDKNQRKQLAKEQQDVLRVVLGIVQLYGLEHEFPTSLASFQNDEKKEDTIEYIVALGVASGELASTINHAEGMGIKKEKHPEDARQRILQKAMNVTQIVSYTIDFFETEDELNRQITASYAFHKEKGFIPTKT